MVNELPAPGRGPFMTPAEVDAQASRPADHIVAYGDDEAQLGDLRLPTGSGPHPVVVVVHGGCWLSHYASRLNTAAQADGLRRAGLATWNIEYRCADQAGGGWPGTFHDVTRAIDHLRRLADAYPLDLNRVVATGHSAGGHLALWAAARHRLPIDSPLRYRRQVRIGDRPLSGDQWSANDQPVALTGVVVLGGPGDLSRFRRLAAAPEACAAPVVEMLLGGSPEAVPERYAHASPVELLPIGVPQIFITGEYDYVISPTEVEHYLEIARHHGDTVEQRVVAGAAHHEYNVPGSVAWPYVESAVLELLGR